MAGWSAQLSSWFLTGGFQIYTHSLNGCKLEDHLALPRYLSNKMNTSSHQGNLTHCFHLWGLSWYAPLLTMGNARAWPNCHLHPFWPDPAFTYHLRSRRKDFYLRGRYFPRKFTLGGEFVLSIDSLPGEGFRGEVWSCKDYVPCTSTCDGDQEIWSSKWGLDRLIQPLKLAWSFDLPFISGVLITWFLVMRIQAKTIDHAHLAFMHSVWDQNVAVAGGNTV